MYGRTYYVFEYLVCIVSINFSGHQNSFWKLAGYFPYVNESVVMKM